MEANCNTELTKQKQQALLISSYKQAVALLQRPSTQQQGKELLLSILSNPDSSEITLRELRLSTLLSLAQLSKVEGQFTYALYYWYESTKIQSSFNTWIKMAQVLQMLRVQIMDPNSKVKGKLNVGLFEIEQQIEFVYKNAIKESPVLWRDQLQEKLRQTYIEHGKELQVKDLQEVVRNREYNDIHKDKESSETTKIILNSAVDEKKSQGWLNEVKLPLFLILPQDGQSQESISPWDYLLSICIFFVNQPGGSKKSSKKYEEILVKTAKFSDTKTKMTIESKRREKDDPEKQMEPQEDPQFELKEEDLQKLNSLILEFYKEVAKDNSISQKAKKSAQVLTINYNTKTVFESLQDYLKQIFIAKSINIQLINSFKYLDPHYNPELLSLLQPGSSSFDSVFGPLLKEVRMGEKQNFIVPSNEEQGGSLGARERRSTMQITPQPATPVRRQDSEASKKLESKQKEQRQDFMVWLQKNENKFSNVIHLSYSLVSHIIEAYLKHRVSSDSLFDDSRRTTNRLIGQLLCRLIQISESGILDDNRKSKSIYMILIKYLEDEANNCGSSRTSNMQSFLLAKCMASVDSIVYFNSRLHQQNHQFKYGLETLEDLLRYIYIGILLATMPNFIDEIRLRKLTQFYNKFYSLYVECINSNEFSLHQSMIQPLPEPLKLEELIESRIRKCKIKQLSQQESEESVLIIGQLLKTDMKVSELIDSVKSIVGMSSASILLYLKSFAKVVQTLFNNLESNNGFNLKFIQNSMKSMEISTLIEALHVKLTEDKKVPKENKDKGLQQGVQPIIENPNTPSLQKSQYNLKVLTLFNLLKIFLLNELDQTHSSLCLRIVLYLLEDTLQTMSQFHSTQKGKQEFNIHYLHSDQLCQMIIFLESLIKARESSELRKKFYHRILIKNIKYIYELYNQNGSNNMEIRVQIYKIYNETFHSKHFKPKRIEDCLGYFLMISRQFSAQFDKQEVEFEQKMKRVFGQCYLIFKEELSKCFNECERFTRAMEYFVCVMRKKRKQCEEFVNFFTGKQQICECCQGPYLKNVISRQPFAKEVFLIVAKFLENKKNYEKTGIISLIAKPQQGNEEPKEPGRALGFVELDQEVEKYYLRYFLLAVNKGKAWHEMLRFQISKVYQHFDAMIGPEPSQGSNEEIQPSESILQLYKHKFKYAKTIGSFIVRNFHSSDFAEAKQYALYRINLTNTLKICQRKFNKKLTQMSKVPALSKQFTNKYMEGIATVMTKKKESEDQQFAIGNSFPQIKFLIYTQFMVPFMLYSCEQTPEIQLNATLMKTTVQQGISLIKEFKRNEMASMIDQSQELNIVRSKYNTKYLGKELKVQILVFLSRMVLNILKLVQTAAALMAKDTGIQDPNTKRFSLKNQGINQQEEDSKIVLKLQFLVEINKLILLMQPQLEAWRQELKELKEPESMDKEEAIRVKPKTFEFKDKYLFPDYTSTIQQIEDSLYKFILIFDLISKNGAGSRSKKENYTRYIFCCNLWSSKIYHQMGCRDLCLNYVKEISNLKNEDLVNFYHHYENEPTEQNYVLAEYYSRDIVFHCLKIEAVEHLLAVYSSKFQTLETCITMIRKLGKMYVHKIQPQKEKMKSKMKEQEPKEGENMIKENKKNEETSKKKLKEDKDTQKEKTGKKPKKEGKQKEGKEKVNKLEKRIKWIFILFLKGVEYFFESIVNEVNLKNEPVDEKYEKALLQFKNKIKREVEKEKKKPTTQSQKMFAMKLVNDMESFVQFYESKFVKKIRMKGKKKEKVQTQDPNPTIKPSDPPLQQGNQMVTEKSRECPIKLENEENQMSEEEIQNEQSQNADHFRQEIKQEEQQYEMNDGDIESVNNEEIRDQNGQEDSDNP